MNKRNPLLERPSFEDLLALRSGKLDETRAEIAREALVEDPELARDMLDLGDLGNLEDELATFEAASGLDEGAVDQAWARFESRLSPAVAATEIAPAEQPSAERPSAERPSARPRSFPTRRFGSPLAWAASFLFGCLATWSLMTQWSGTDPPRAGEWVFKTLQANEDAGPFRGPESRLQTPARARLLILRLVPPRVGLADYPSAVEYRLVAGGSTLDEGSSAFEDDDEAYLLILEIDDLDDSKDYQVVLSRKGGQAQPWATYDFRLASEK